MQPSSHAATGGGSKAAAEETPARSPSGNAELFEERVTRRFGVRRGDAGACSEGPAAGAAAPGRRQARLQLVFEALNALANARRDATRTFLHRSCPLDAVRPRPADAGGDATEKRTPTPPQSHARGAGENRSFAAACPPDSIPISQPQPEVQAQLSTPQPSELLTWQALRGLLAADLNLMQNPTELRTPQASRDFHGVSGPKDPLGDRKKQANTSADDSAGIVHRVGSFRSSRRDVAKAFIRDCADLSQISRRHAVAHVARAHLGAENVPSRVGSSEGSHSGAADERDLSHPDEGPPTQPTECLKPQTTCDPARNGAEAEAQPSESLTSKKRQANVSANAELIYRVGSFRSSRRDVAKAFIRNCTDLSQISRMHAVAHVARTHFGAENVPSRAGSGEGSRQHSGAADDRGHPHPDEGPPTHPTECIKPLTACEPASNGVQADAQPTESLTSKKRQANILANAELIYRVGSFRSSRRDVAKAFIRDCADLSQISRMHAVAHVARTHFGAENVPSRAGSGEGSRQHSGAADDRGHPHPDEGPPTQPTECLKPQTTREPASDGGQPNESLTKQRRQANISANAELIYRVGSFRSSRRDVAKAFIRDCTDLSHISRTHAVAHVARAEFGARSISGADAHPDGLNGETQHDELSNEWSKRGADESDTHSSSTIDPAAEGEEMEAKMEHLAESRRLAAGSFLHAVGFPGLPAQAVGRGRLEAGRTRRGPEDAKSDGTARPLHPPLAPVVPAGECAPEPSLRVASAFDRFCEERRTVAAGHGRKDAGRNPIFSAAGSPRPGTARPSHLRTARSTECAQPDAGGMFPAGDRTLRVADAFDRFCWDRKTVAAQLASETLRRLCPLDEAGHSGSQVPFEAPAHAAARALQCGAVEQAFSVYREQARGAARGFAAAALAAPAAVPDTRGVGCAEGFSLSREQARVATQAPPVDLPAGGPDARGVGCTEGFSLSKEQARVAAIAAPADPPAASRALQIAAIERNLTAHRERARGVARGFAAAALQRAAGRVPAGFAPGAVPSASDSFGPPAAMPQEPVAVPLDADSEGTEASRREPQGGGAHADPRRPSVHRLPGTAEKPEEGAQQQDTTRPPVLNALFTTELECRRHVARELAASFTDDFTARHRRHLTEHERAAEAKQVQLEGPADRQRELDAQKPSRPRGKEPGRLRTPSADGGSRASGEGLPRGRQESDLETGRGGGASESSRHRSPSNRTETGRGGHCSRSTDSHSFHHPRSPTDPQAGPYRSPTDRQLGHPPADHFSSPADSPTKLQSIRSKTPPLSPVPPPAAPPVLPTPEAAGRAPASYRQTRPAPMDPEHIAEQNAAAGTPTPSANFYIGDRRPAATASPRPKRLGSSVSPGHREAALAFGRRSAWGYAATPSGGRAGGRRLSLGVRGVAAGHPSATVPWADRPPLSCEARRPGTAAAAGSCSHRLSMPALPPFSAPLPLRSVGGFRFPGGGVREAKGGSGRPRTASPAFPYSDPFSRSPPPSPRRGSCSPRLRAERRVVEDSEAAERAAVAVDEAAAALRAQVAHARFLAQAAAPQPPAAAAPPLPHAPKPSSTTSMSARFRAALAGAREADTLKMWKRSAAD
eukprot:gene17791-27406_t